MRILCAICNELLDNSVEIHVTPCGHIFHFKCLSQWLPRSSTCPECRRKTTLSTIQKVYFNISLDHSLIDDPAVLQEKLSEAHSEIKSLTNKVTEISAKITLLKKKNVQLENNLLKKEAAYDAMKHQYNYYKVQMKELNELKEKLQGFHTKMQTMEKVEELLKSTSNEVDAMVSCNTSCQDLAVFVSVLKRELRSSEDKRKTITTAYQQSQHELIKLKAKCNEYKQKFETQSNAEQKLTEFQKEKNILLDRIKELENNAEYCKSFSPQTKLQNNLITTNTGSPYLQVESSSVGMMPLRNLLNSNQALEKRKLVKDNGQFSIFKKPRLAKVNTMASLYTPSSSKNSGN